MKKNYTEVFFNDSPHTFKSYNLSTSAPKQKKSQLDKKFDELLNRKCSWSYRSQNTAKKKDMESYADKLQPMQTTLAVQISENKREKALNDLSPCINKENSFYDDTEKIDEENESLKGIQDEGNNLQMKTRSTAKTTLQKKFKSINVKLRTSLSNNTKTTKISMNETVSSPSSSDEEILQTRLSVKNKNIFEADECQSSDKCFSNRGSRPENDSNPKISPIIIQATSYDPKNVFTDPHNNNMTGKKQGEIININKTNMETGSKTSPSFEANYSSNEVENNSLQISKENRIEQFSKCYLGKNNNHEELLKKLMKNMNATADQDSTGTKLEKSKVNSHDIVRDFLNGSFDISDYQMKKNPTLENFKKSVPSNLDQFENISLSTKQASVKNVQERSKYDKIITNELIKANNRAKQNTSNNDKKKLFQNSPEVLKRLNKKSDTSYTKNIPKLQTEIKREEKKSVHKKSEQNGKLNLKASAKAKERNTAQQRNKAKDTSFKRKEQVLINNEFIDSPNQTSLIKRSTSQNRRKNYDITAAAFDSSTPIRRSTRKVRNSSLVASKRIKEIEKLENLSDSHEELMTGCDKEVHYTSTPYSFKKYSDYFLTENTYTNNRKTKHKNKELNIDKNKKPENASEEHFNSKDTLKYYTRANSIENTKPIRHNITVSENMQNSPLKIFDQNDNNSLQKGILKRTDRNFISDLVDTYFTQEKSSDSEENLQNRLAKRRKKGKAEDSKNEDDRSFYKVKPYKPLNNAKSFLSFHKATESKHRTWDMLERDLLKELDDMPITANVCKTVILKEKEVVSKKKIENDTNLFTVSNTSMVKTISKSKTGNKYNMQYEIKNTESKFLESKIETPRSMQSRYNIPKSKETVLRNSQNINILDRAIAAMEECTRKFISPQVKINDFEKKDTDFQSDNSDEKQTQFHSSITFIANDSKQCYSNEIIGCMKKSSRRREKNINFKQKSNVMKVLNDLSDPTGESDNGNLENAGHSELSLSASRDYLSENQSLRNSCNENNQALVPYSANKHIDRWGRLMKELDLEGDCVKDKKEHPVLKLMDISEADKNVIKYCSETLITESDLKNTKNNSKRKRKKLNSVDFKTKKAKFDEKTLNKQLVVKPVPNNITELILSHTPKSNNICSEERSNSCEKELKKNDKHKNLEKNEENKKERIEKPLEEIDGKTKITEEQVLREPENNVRGFPKYKFKIDRNGALKIKTSKSSSASNSSKDFMRSKKIASDDSKNNKTIKSKEKYGKYVKNLTFTDFLITKKDKTEEETKPKEIESREIEEENANQGKNKQIIRKIKLIAENEDDIFSISSSDSEASKKTPGCGLLCDQFDE